MSRTLLRIATRASNLALWQANCVAALLRSLDSELDVELIRITTTGDRVEHTTIRRLGGFGVFTREIQLAVLDHRADLAVHSLKDLPTETVDGIVLAAVPERASPYDALILPRSLLHAGNLGDLPAEARVGTGSLRRRAQILHLRPDLQFLDVRGNVETRLSKLDDGAYDALILAEAGLSRLGLSDRVSARLAPPDLYPAVGQGALGIECRSEDQFVRTIVERVSHASSLAAVTAERQVLAQLRAGCHAPVGVSTTVQGTRLTLEAVVLSSDGRTRLHAEATGILAEPNHLGTELADNLLRQGAGPLIEAAAK